MVLREFKGFTLEEVLDLKANQLDWLVMGLIKEDKERKKRENKNGRKH